jgi:hypothetical protein
MNSTRKAEAALLAPQAPARSGMVKTSISSSTNILLIARKANRVFRSRFAGCRERKGTQIVLKMEPESRLQREQRPRFRPLRTMDAKNQDLLRRATQSSALPESWKDYFRKRLWEPDA